MGIGHGAWGMGHGAWGMGQGCANLKVGAWGIGHGVWDLTQESETQHSGKEAVILPRLPVAIRYY
ncbi:hypothetical protein [Microcoleus sp. FACHB-672]|uniref:hypothetical protein n=1 Tax=Microcoleus sp. FACHB-672 TaxID=2692825 RepID=UPI0016822AC9|nr:hypothetical protein [Microcoleus sp. FACHB-672]MBD2040993.1 hypothetical protein [Microcoleus sp. FACHB-672]